MEAEVLVYIGKLRKYLNTNREAYEHFIGDMDENKFFDLVNEVAIKNYHEKNDPTLTMEQFEIVKKTLQIDHIASRDDSYYEPKIFIDNRGLERIITK
jgi:hypothetical protein